MMRTRLGWGFAERRPDAVEHPGRAVLVLFGLPLRFGPNLPKLRNPL
jgi:hypothetical protein